MQTSKGLMSRIATCCFAVTLLFAFDALITFVRMPYGTKSQVSWVDYGQVPDGELDTIIIGTSTIMAGLDPQVLNNRLGATAYNLGSPTQWIEESYIALKTAYEDHHVTRAILGITHVSASREGVPNTGSTFMFMRSLQVSPKQNFEAYSYLLTECDTIGKPESLGFIAPWAYGSVDNDLTDLYTNVKMKLDGTTLYEAARISDHRWAYQGNGFGPYNANVKYDWVGPYYRMDDIADDVDNLGSSVIDPSREAALIKLCDYCEEHDIELIAVVVPIPAYRIIEYGKGYEVLDDAMKKFFEEHGAQFYDFNLARPELMDLSTEIFGDTEHLNTVGAEAFSQAFCDVVESVQAGNDVDDLFWTIEDYLRSVDYIAAVFLDREPHEDGIHLRARAMAGSDVDVEYQFMVKAGETWVVVRDWSRDNTFVYYPENGRRGEVTLCVNARQVGSDEEYERYRVIQAMY